MNGMMSPIIRCCERQGRPSRVVLLFLQTQVLLMTLFFLQETLAVKQKFCVIADVPYNAIQEKVLDKQMRNNIPTDCSFLLHLGDYRKAGPPCKLEDFQKAATILKKSPVPVFPLLGDNDSIDCPNVADGIAYWTQTFKNFALTNWNYALDVSYQPKKSNFVIRLGDTLIFGMTILSNSIADVDDNGLKNQFNWLKQEILSHTERLRTENKVGRVVIACHTKSEGDVGAPFFDPLRLLIANDLNNGTPILLLHGHSHEWYYEPRFYSQPSFLRINIAGEAIEPPTIITVNESGQNEASGVAFEYDRQLPSCRFLFLFQGVTVSFFLFGSFCVSMCDPLWEWKINSWNNAFVGTCP